jgi:hypothetical protein
MRHIKSFEKHNESWRQTKAYLKIPALIVDTALSKILNYIPKLNFLYNSMAAKIDTGTSFNSGHGQKIDVNIQEITLSDIKDNKVKKSLMLSGLLKNWKVYRLDRVSHDGKSPIYLSKEDLKKGDFVHGQRLSTDEKNVEFYVVAAKHTEEHKEMSKERNERYKNKKYKEYNDKVNKAIKIGRFMGRSSGGDLSPLFHNLIKEGFLDLVKKCLDNQKDSEKKRQMIVFTYNSDGEKDNSSKGKNSLDLATEKVSKFSSGGLIKDLLEKTLYNLWLEKKNKKDE